MSAKEVVKEGVTPLWDLEEEREKKRKNYFRSQLEAVSRYAQFRFRGYHIIIEHYETEDELILKIRIPSENWKKERKKSTSSRKSS